MGQPKKRTTSRRTRNRRSHERLDLARRVNATSPVKVFTTAKQSGKAFRKTETAAAVKPAKAASK